MTLERKVLAGVLAIFLLATWLTTRSTLWDRDEPRFSQAAVEMVHSGQWVYPTFNGELRPDKPILIYWLMAIPLSLFGTSEWAVRAWAPVGLALAAWLTWRVGRRVLSPSAAALAPLLLACTPIAVFQGTAATTDAVLLATITAAMACFAALCFEGGRARLWVALALALGLAQLTKGPVGLAVPVLAMLAAAWLLRGKGALPRHFGLHLALAALAGVLLFLAWAIPANEATGGQFAKLGLGKHVVDRMSGAMEGHGAKSDDPWTGALLYAAGLFFYLPVLLVGFAPWILQLPAALLGAWSGRLVDGKARALLLGWTLAPFLLMSLVATKLPHYVLPIFPPLALLVAATIDAAERGTLAPRELRWLARGAWLYGSVLALEVASLVFLAFQEQASALSTSALLLAGLIALQGALALSLHVRSRWRAAALVQVAGSLAAWLFIGAVVLPRAEEVKLAPRLAAKVRASAGQGAPAATYGFDEPSLNFYLGAGPIRHLGTHAELRDWMAEPGPGVLVLPRSRESELPRERSMLSELASVDGYNYSKGKSLELVALLRSAK